MLTVWDELCDLGEGDFLWSSTSSEGGTLPKDGVERITKGDENLRKQIKAYVGTNPDAVA